MNQRGWARSLALALLAFSPAGCEQDDGVHRLRVGDSREHWERRGFVEMVPPLRLPSRAPTHRTRVLLKLPDSGSIRVERSADGRQILAFPAGTEAIRLEEARGKSGEFVVEDGRGTRLGDPERFQVLRRVERPSRALAGFEWNRQSPKQGRRATDLLVALLASQKASPGAQRHARVNNDCASCHPAQRPPNQRSGQYGVANRGTDASGFYQPQTVLLNSVPIESYHPNEPNRSDPFISYFCPSGATAVEDRRQVTCSDASVPWGRFDVAGALSAGDARARSLCRARRYLFERLESSGKSSFAAAMAECADAGTKGRVEPARAVEK